MVVSLTFSPSVVLSCVAQHLLLLLLLLLTLACSRLAAPILLGCESEVESYRLGPELLSHCQAVKAVVAPPVDSRRSGGESWKWGAGGGL